MMNQVLLVGRIAKLNEDTETLITLAISRNFKNKEGIYETDFIDCQLFGSVAESTKYYCKNGDIVGIKGRLQTDNEKMIVVADKVTFLTTKKDNDNIEQE